MATLNALAYHKPAKISEREPEEEQPAAEVQHDMLRWANAMKRQLSGD